MKQEMSKPTSPEALETGILLGQNQAFAIIAGRCSAAQAAAIRRLRNEKLYRSVTTNWAEFCTTHLKMTKRNANMTIALLEEFGPDYFEVSQITRISPETYRALQPSIRDGALHHDGEAIALIEANAQQVAAAVAEMRRAKAPATVRELPERVEALARRWDDLLEEFRAIVDERDRRYNHVLTATLDRIRMNLDGVRRGI